MFKFTRTMFVLLLSAFIAVACTSNPTTESTGEFVDSSAITARVKASLIDNLGTKALPIKVKTFKDKVQLSGFVNQAETKLKAGQIASKTANVKLVINNIIVK